MDSLHSGQWDRLDAVIKWLELTPHSFAREIGLNRSENLYRIKNNKNGISRRLAAQIVEKYPTVNDVWLLTGSGSMLKSDKFGDIIEIPYYSNGINQYLSEPDKLDSSFSMPNFFKANLAIDSHICIAEDIIPEDSVVFLKNHTTKKIVYGKLYYIVMELYNEFCYLTKSNNENKLIMHGSDPKNGIEIDISEILHIFLVDSFIKKL